MGANYTDEEMKLLSHTPHFVGSAMAFVGNSGLFGTGKEMFTSAQSIMSGVKDYPNNANPNSVTQHGRWNFRSHGKNEVS